MQVNYQWKKRKKEKNCQTRSYRKEMIRFFKGLITRVNPLTVLTSLIIWSVWLVDDNRLGNSAVRKKKKNRTELRYIFWKEIIVIKHPTLFHFLRCMHLFWKHFYLNLWYFSDLRYLWVFLKRIYIYSCNSFPYKMYQFPYANVLALTTLCESEEMNFIRVFNSMSVLKLRSMRATCLVGILYYTENIEFSWMWYCYNIDPFWKMFLNNINSQLIK